jgi:hypothetical protein
MVKKKLKTSISPNRVLWLKWKHYVIDKNGDARSITSETEKAVKEYMEMHPIK